MPHLYERNEGKTDELKSNDVKERLLNETKSDLSLSENRFEYEIMERICNYEVYVK